MVNELLIKKKLEELKDLRDRAAARKMEIDAIAAEYDERIQGDLEALKELNEHIADAETIIRESTIEQYRQDLQKHRDFGIEVKITKSINYSEDKALKFAKEHGLFLQLDKKGFEKFAKENYEKEEDLIRFVTMIEAPKVFIPSEIKVE